MHILYVLRKVRHAHGFKAKPSVAPAVPSCFSRRPMCLSQRKGWVCVVADLEEVMPESCLTEQL